MRLFVVVAALRRVDLNGTLAHNALLDLQIDLKFYFWFLLTVLKPTFSTKVKDF